MNTNKKNIIGLMYIGIGTYPQQIGDRTKEIKQDISRLSQFNNINSIQIINNNAPHPISKIKWSAEEIIKQLTYLRNTIISGIYAGYILIYVSHGDNKGNGAFSVPSKFTKQIAYKTIKNSMRNARDIPTTNQRIPRICLIYTCKGGLEAPYTKYDNSNTLNNIQ
eukprot:951084_1